MQASGFQVWNTTINSSLVLIWFGSNEHVFVVSDIKLSCLEHNLSMQPALVEIVTACLYSNFTLAKSA
jgi:hypothetical protein